MTKPAFDRSSTLAEVYDHPVGRDVIDRLLLALGRSPRLVTNRLVSRLSLGRVERLTTRFTGPGLVETVIDLLNSDPDRVADVDREPQWWQSAVVYQIYPRSFADSNGDGTGDLRGIIDHLDHLASLGVDCLWLSPVFDSPNEDFGYDIRDYRAVMAEMGSLADLDELIAGVHDRGMRIILDLVVNHTSDQHPWFTAALADPDGPAGARYFLRPGSPEQPPNNWTSFFSGSAWRWYPEAERWALHLFAPGQPDLDWQNPEVRAEVAAIMRFWTDRGVDGFRLDVINYISKAPDLPDGNLFIGTLMGFVGIEHYFYGPRLHEYLREIRSQGAPDRSSVLVGETPGAGIEMGRLLTNAGRDELDLIFNFDHLENPGRTRFDDYRYDLNALKANWINQQTRLGRGDWTSVFYDNHDNPRMVSKVDPAPAQRDAVAKLLATLQLTMRGTPFIYQGAEIAAVNQPFTDASQLRDIESLRMLAEGADWTRVLAGARDHARVPMRWDASASGGFTTGEPWLPGLDQTPGFSVAEQDADPDSVLNHYRRLIALRRSSDALRLGEIEFSDITRKDHFAYHRRSESDHFLIEANLSARRRPARHREAGEIVLGTSSAPGAWLEPYEAVIYRIS